MPILVPPLPPMAVDVRPFWETEESAIAQGREGEQVREQIESVSRHWRQQSRDAIGDIGCELLDELSGYRHPPFERVGTLRVRFTHIDELKPRTITFDEDEE